MLADTVRTTAGSVEPGIAASAHRAPA